MERVPLVWSVRQRWKGEGDVLGSRTGRERMGELGAPLAGSLQTRRRLLLELTMQTGSRYFEEKEVPDWWQSGRAERR